MATQQKPVSVTGPGNGSITVNRADNGDANVVVSWTGEAGIREAAGLTPADAQRMAIALIVASQIVGGSI